MQLFTIVQLLLALPLLAAVALPQELPMQACVQAATGACDPSCIYNWDHCLETGHSVKSCFFTTCDCGFQTSADSPPNGRCSGCSMCQGVPDMHMDAVEPKSVDTVTDTVLKRDNDVDDSDTCPSACWWTLADCIHISRLGTVTGNPDCHAQTCGSKHNIKSASAGYCASCIFCQPGVFKDPQAPEPFVIDGKKREGVEREVEYPETDMPALKDVQGKKGCESWCKTIYDDCMKRCDWKIECKSECMAEATCNFNSCNSCSFCKVRREDKLFLD